MWSPPETVNLLRAGQIRQQRRFLGGEFKELPCGMECLESYPADAR